MYIIFLGFYAIGLAGKWLVEVSIIVSQLGMFDLCTVTIIMVYHF